MVLAMVNEGARCLDEGVVESPEDVDFAMVTGAGWAPFRGGPLRYADTIGVDRVVAALSRLANEVGPRFAPCDRLAEMARTQKRFYEH
jgi:3-hydroxyacyl-CoA dehydrogenase/enoyl-CoA hydratase/3-hydroxybutyryl-CoA epimerase